MHFYNFKLNFRDHCPYELCFWFYFPHLTQLSPSICPSVLNSTKYIVDHTRNSLLRCNMNHHFVPSLFLRMLTQKSSSRPTGKQLKFQAWFGWEFSEDTLRAINCFVRNYYLRERRHLYLLTQRNLSQALTLFFGWRQLIEVILRKTNRIEIRSAKASLSSYEIQI